MTWHVMMQPHDWARTYLKHRFTENSPNYAFELSSYTAEEYEVRSVNLEDAFAESMCQ